MLTYQELAQTTARPRTLLAIPAPNKFSSLKMLTYGKNITIWIFEPRHLVTCGCCPNAKFTILNKRIFFEGNASFAQPSDDRFDVFYFPAQNGALGWSEVLDSCNPNLVPADAHDQRILIGAHKLKSKLAFIKSPRFVVIPCGNKANYLS